MNKILKFALPLALLSAAQAVQAQVLTEEARMPKVAGQFYPDDPVELQELVQELFQRQTAPAGSRKPKILIVPHAGYQYSGLVAAAGFRQVQGQHYDGVVVVGFTHRQQFPGASVDTREVYQTPLGEIPVDQEAVAVLLAQPGLGHFEEAHESGEHSLEVELPFLQVALGRFKLVPVLMGNADAASASRLAAALAKLAAMGDYLFVFSSDLSHYHAYDDAERRDEATTTAILQETPQAVDRLFSAQQLEACGRGPIVTSLFLARRIGDPERKMIFRANSGDTYGNPSSVVGYASLAMYDRPGKSGAGFISPQAGAALVQAARQSLERSVVKARSKIDVPLERYPELSRANGIFVTLRQDGQLRGCVGRIETPEPLRSSVLKVAVDAATQDHRFTPVTPAEVPALHVEVSVLSPAVRLKSLEDLVPGRDGVILEAQGRRGLFLPQVWQDTGWTRLEFLRELASQKTGLPPDAWKDAVLYVFQDQAFEENPTR